MRDLRSCRPEHCRLVAGSTLSDVVVVDGKAVVAVQLVVGLRRRRGETGQSYTGLGTSYCEAKMGRSQSADLGIGCKLDAGSRLLQAEIKLKMKVILTVINNEDVAAITICSRRHRRIATQRPVSIAVGLLVTA